MISLSQNLSAIHHVFYGSKQQPAVKNQSTYKTSHFTVEKSVLRFSNQVGTDTRQNIGDQNALHNFNRLSIEDKAALTYNGKPISDLSPEQAGDLIKEDGYFGINKTSQRIADFVIKGAAGNIEKLKSGKEGVLRGFQEAEKAWGGQLPEISYKTLEKTLAAIDEQLQELGESAVNFVA